MEKPDTHLKVLHSKYITIIKLRSKPKREIYNCMEYLVTWLHHNIQEYLNLIAGTSTALFEGLKPHDKKPFTTVLRMYHQQKEMFSCSVHRCPEPIISIFQPHMRPIFRGEAKVKFGAKTGTSIMKGYTFIDRHNWKTYNECKDLATYLKNYKRCFNLLPKKVEADKIYLSHRNQRILKLLKIETGDKPLGLLSKEQQTTEYQEQMAKDIERCNEIEATFGTGKRVYRANDIRAKLPDTGASWTATCYFMKNVMKVPKRTSSRPYPNDADSCFWKWYT